MATCTGLLLLHYLFASSVRARCPAVCRFPATHCLPPDIDTDNDNDNANDNEHDSNNNRISNSYGYSLQLPLASLPAA